MASRCSSREPSSTNLPVRFSVVQTTSTSGTSAACSRTPVLWVVRPTDLTRLLSFASHQALRAPILLSRFPDSYGLPEVSVLWADFIGTL